MDRPILWLAGACAWVSGLWGCGPGLPARLPAEEEKGWGVGAVAESPAAPQVLTSAPIPTQAPIPAKAAVPAPVPSPAPAPAALIKRSRPEPGRTAFVYRVKDGTPGCDTEADLRLWIKNYMGYDPLEPTGPPRSTVSATVDRQGKAYHGVIEVRTEDGELWYQDEFWERSCVRVSDRIIIIVSGFVFPPDMPPLEPEPTPAEPDCNDACARSHREAIQELRARHDALRARHDALQARQDALEKEVRALKNRVIAGNMDLTYALSTGVLMTANLTPNVGPGVWLGGELRTGPFALALEARAALPSSVQVGPYTTDWSEYTLLLVPCGRYRYVVDFFGCGVVGGGFRWDYDPDYPYAVKSNFGGLVRLGGRLGGEVPFMDNRLAVRAWADILYKLPTTTIEYLKDGEPEAVRTIPDISAFIGAGLVIKFGKQEAR